MPRRFPLPALLCLGLAACGGAKPFEVSDQIYSAPGEAAVVQQLVAAGAAQCWPGADERLAGLRIVQTDLDGSPAMVLKRPVEDGGAPEDAMPYFAVRFVGQADRETRMFFPVLPEEEDFARRLRDDVLLWANGSKSCA